MTKLLSIYAANPLPPHNSPPPSHGFRLQFPPAACGHFGLVAFPRIPFPLLKYFFTSFSGTYFPFLCSNSFHFPRTCSAIFSPSISVT